MKKLIFVLTLFTSLQLKAQCNKSVKELEQLSLMDTTQFKAYAMKHDIEFTNRNEEFLEYHCSKEKSTKFIIKFTSPKWFQYEFVEKTWYDSYFKQLRERGYNIVEEDYGQRFASKTFSFEIIATDGGFYEVMIHKK
jgi:hypothetical protein